MTQVWRAVLGPVGLVIIGRYLSPAEQGFYYTFGSILALQMFVELGLSTVIIQFASHEWAFLNRKADCSITGDDRALSRLASLTRFSLKWYCVCGLLVIFGIGTTGLLFFSWDQGLDTSWMVPWILLCVLAGLTLMLTPVLALIEGCNQVESVYSYRFFEASISTIVGWVALLAGWKLYALGVSAFVRLSCILIFLFWKHGVFVRQLLKHKSESCISWRSEIWPFQRRMVITWFSGYFVFSLFNPVMFHYFGPVVAGQMGMTLVLASAVLWVSLPFVSARNPQFGMLIAKRRYDELDALFKRLLTATMIFSTAAASGIFFIIYMVKTWGIFLSDRFLSLTTVAVFLASFVLQAFVSSLAVYMRAHKVEPMMIPSLVCAIMVGFSTWYLGRRYGPLGAAWGYLAIGVFFSVPSCLYVYHKLIASRTRDAKKYFPAPIQKLATEASSMQCGCWVREINEPQTVIDQVKI